MSFVLYLIASFGILSSSLVSAHGENGLVHSAKFRVALSSRAVFNGFQIVEPGSLEGLGLGSTCEQVLYQPLKCDEKVAGFSSPSYHRSLGDQALTTSVCDSSCSNVLQIFSRRVNTACTAKKELFPGFPVAALIDTIWGGWNETCLKDTQTGQYCNDIIESWPEVDSLEEMPKANLCSFCYTKKLAVMQQNKFGVYGEGGYQDTYDYVVKTCGLPGSTVTAPNTGVVVDNSSPPFTCGTGRSYTAKSDDTCDSIAKANSVSSTSIYTLNPSLLDCNNVAAGSELCLPLSCDKLYEVKPQDDCVAVAVANQVSWQNIVQWNGMIDPTCSNIAQTNPNFGKMLCISPPGGTFSTPPANQTDGNTGGPGGSGSGYSDNDATLPAGATLAPKTTIRCGEYYTVKSGDTCQNMLVAAHTPADLFLAVNPSLRNDLPNCDKRIKVGLTYCIHPNKNWNEATSSTTSS